MQRLTVSRNILGSVLALCCLLAVTLGFTFFFTHTYASKSAAYVTLSGSFITAPKSAHFTGAHTSDQQLTITLTLQSSHATQMNNLLADLYTPGSSEYHHWLKPGEFNSLFAPTATEQKAVQTFLKQAGLSITDSPSPFLVRASGTTAQIETALRTHINDYQAANGQAFFQNDTAIQIPSTLSSLVIGVSGLSNTNKAHTNYITTHAAAQATGQVTPQYGAGPGGSGLTPSQTSSLYNANPVYKLGDEGMGKGATLAVFELSSYTQSDISVFEQKFFGPNESVPLVNINVDGGPITPNCPKGDTCASNDFSGDAEVAADIEMQIAIAPKISQVLVYNAPNDALGITITDEYFQIAKDDVADSISSSWGACEKDAGLGTAVAESLAFFQMALQGQSMFSAAGDTGAFDCLRGSGFPGLNVDDPSSQPFVTAVGGTSFGNFDPGATQQPDYPTGFETVWNVLNRCSTKNPLACVTTGATGGGVSTFWGQPDYQTGPGVANSFSQTAPSCVLAHAGQACREIPDISANADEFTPYTVFCTGSLATNSACATISASQPVPGFLGIGGTSLSSPIWSGIIALWDSVHGQRLGNANTGLYQLFNTKNSYKKFFHDITGINQTENNNGFYPTTPAYDMATGIGTPSIAGIVSTNP
jgi:subtilase family serine protease